MKEKSFLIGIVLGIILISGFIYFLSQKPLSSEFSKVKATVYYQQNCNCCKEYIGYLRSSGFNVETKILSLEELEQLKKNLGLSEDLYSCHTVIIDKYFVEGHVPLGAIKKLLNEKPDIDGIALPGMPSGSPGMSGFKISPFKIHSVKDSKDQGVFIEI